MRHSNLKWIFSIVSLGIMIMGFMFSIYTFRNPRYMFKRLAGGIHFISALTVLVVIEVLISSLTHIRQSLPYAYPRQATQSYGYSSPCCGLDLFGRQYLCTRWNCLSSGTPKKRRGDTRLPYRRGRHGCDQPRPSSARAHRNLNNIFRDPALSI
ncbi:unnamed protein product [Bemisia tabaci]|uniref:Uncharacterized protein n=1 Tax=Bemisia tabaci TaxID=7038 RepID=A0A9P0F1D9_BEMTA|nr:unnamed protein product [Bemisia tabaci]